VLGFATLIGHAEILLSRLFVTMLFMSRLSGPQLCGGWNGPAKNHWPFRLGSARIIAAKARKSSAADGLKSLIKDPFSPEAWSIP
jgi:hypothetical protein